MNGEMIDLIRQNEELRKTNMEIVIEKDHLREENYYLKKLIDKMLSNKESGEK